MSDLKDIYFFKHCQQILSRLKDEEILNLKNIADNKVRLEELYRYSVNVEIPNEFMHKDYNAAEKLKSLGNDYFKKQENFKAVECYNQGIVICPQNYDNGKNLLSLLVANRSAAFFDLKRYKKTLFNIDYLLDLGHYPEESLYKIFIRKGKCHEEEKDVLEAIKSFAKAKNFILKSKLSEKEKTKKNEEVEKNLKALEIQLATNKPDKQIKPKDVNNLEGSLKDNLNEKINYIKVEMSPTLGRYATASRDLEIGEVILNNEPFTYCAAVENFLKNCQYCLKSTNNFIACDKCSGIVFCSRSCKTNAQVYHQYECSISKFLSSAGVSVNCLLALRMITQNPVDYFLRSEEAKFQLKDQYDSKDYNTVLNLCNHNNKRPSGQFVHYSCMAIFLLRLLKTTGYFKNPDVKDKLLTSCELKIGLRILEHLLLLEYNAHEVSEVSLTVVKGIPDQHTETIGGALYVNLAFFNHSCEPSIIRYNVGTTMIVRAIKPIKKGDTIYENYGPMYTTERRQARQEYLEKRYCFNCQCVPCVQDWPHLDAMNPSVFKMTCKNESCRMIMVIHKDNSNITLKCPKCETPNNFMNALVKLIDMDKITKEGEAKYKEKDYWTAADKYYQALRICYEYITPPHKDIVQLHQRLRECLIHFGNHRDEPPFDKQFPNLVMY